MTNKKPRIRQPSVDARHSTRQGFATPVVPTLPMNRRTFISSLLAATATLPLPAAETGASRKFTLSLSPGSIGVGAGQRDALALAARHGFESVEPYSGELTRLSAEESVALLASLRDQKLVWGAAGLPVDFRGPEEKFDEGLKQLVAQAAALQRVGASRVGTWLSPGHNSLTYHQNFEQHRRRLRAVAEVLKDHGLRLGLEYVGTISSRIRARYTFIHTLAEARELIAEIGTGNVGVVLDSWHWWQACDTETDLLALRPAEVVAADLNDAPAGVAKEQQQDGRRELPAATGVLPVAGFLQALVAIGFDGPIRAEPFNKPLNDLDNDAACAATIAAMRKAMSEAGLEK